MSRRSSRELRRRLKEPAPEAPPELLQRLKKAIPEERFGEAPTSPAAGPSRHWGGWGQREWGIAAGVVILVASGLLAIRLGPREASSEEAGSFEAVTADRGAPIDEVAAEARQGNRAQERENQASEPTAPAPATTALSGTPESDDEGTGVPAAAPGVPEAAAEDPAGARESHLSPRPQPSRALRSKSDAPMAPLEKGRAEEEPLADAEAKKEAPMALEESREAPAESRLREQPQPSRAPAKRAATASSAAPVAIGAQGAALERPFTVQIEAQRVERGAWLLEGTVGESGARPDFADAAGPLALRLVSAPESVARREADRDLAAQEITQEAGAARDAADPTDRRGAIQAPVAPNGRFSLRVPCDAVAASEATIVLELVDENGTPLERVELPTPAGCARREG